jgi:predicted RNase H-like nuclease
MKYLGIDLGWSTGATGLALVNSNGNLVASGHVVTDTEIDAWIANFARSPLVVAVDAPLVVPNDTGARDGERELASAYVAFGAAPYSSSHKTLGEGPTRAMRLARRHDWSVDPAESIGIGRPTVCLEVYPHPALVSLFGLPYRLAYKKGNQDRRRAGLEQLVELLESIPELRLPEYSRWAEIRRIVADPTQGELKRLDDELDAIVCAYVAWMWHHRRSALRVYGSMRGGYIVAPHPPSYAPRAPKRRGRILSDHFVAGRPSGHGSGRYEQQWRAAVSEIFDAGPSLPDTPVAVELTFFLGADQTGHHEPDLDNMVSATLDALDLDVGRIVASKVPTPEGKDSGAHITIRPARARG